MGGMFAGILISVVAPLVIYYKDAEGNQVVNSTNFTVLAGIFSACAIVTYLLCYKLCTERVVLKQKEKSGEKNSVLKSLGEIVGSRALLGVILSALLLLLASLMSQGLNNYLYADYFKNTTALSMSAMLQLPVMLRLPWFPQSLRSSLERGSAVL